MRSLFAMKVPDARADKRFLACRDTKAGSPGRELLDLIFETYLDEDKNFVKEFQSNGFDARIWELSLHAFFNEEDFDQRRTAGLVDFLVSDGEQTVAVEAVTSQPSGGTGLGPAPATIVGLAPEDLEEGIAEFVHQFGKALWQKVKKRNAQGQAYWELESVAGLPFVVAVEAFHATSSLFHSFGYAAEYLFGRGATATIVQGKLEITPLIIDVHQWKDKSIPSGVFDSEDYKHVSAVIFSNSSSYTQFNRIGLQEGLGESGVHMIRAGTCANQDSEAAEPHQFTYEVGDENAPIEYFSQAMHVFHNPNALKKLPVGFFGRASEHFRLESGHVSSTLRHEFVPFSSVTAVIQTTDS